MLHCEQHQIRETVKQDNYLSLILCNDYVVNGISLNRTGIIYIIHNNSMAVGRVQTVHDRHW